MPSIPYLYVCQSRNTDRRGMGRCFEMIHRSGWLAAHEWMPQSEVKKGWQVRQASGRRAWSPSP
jgi:hypothetical protein